jgi:hypothetical protein
MVATRAPLRATVHAWRTKDVASVRRSRPFLAIGLSAVGVILAWLVISRSLVAYLAVNAPEAALWLQASDPGALLSLAEGHIDAARIREPGKAADAPAASPPPPQKTEPSAKPGEPLRLWSELAKAVTQAREERDREEVPPSSEAPSPSSAVRAMRERVRAWAEAALVNDPINARALRILGQLAQAAGEDGRAASYMQAAARRSIQESVAVDWLMRRNHLKKDHAAALYFADALLRTRSRAMERVLPVLASMAETPEARDELEKLLAGNPPWRRPFLSALPSAVSDARIPLVLLLALRATPNPPTTADIRDYVALLAAHKFYELSYYTWLQFLPAEQLGSTGLLFNGSFEFPPSGLPFDWSLGKGAGATVDIVQRADQAGQRALYIELGPGRVEFGGVAQTLLLAPGSYRFNGRYRGEIVGRRGLIWRVACADAEGPLAQSPMMVGLAAGWKDIAFSFTVPASGCRAQHLRLDLDARMASEQLVSGSVWYDELAIARGG